MRENAGFVLALLHNSANVGDTRVKTSHDPLYKQVITSGLTLWEAVKTTVWFCPKMGLQVQFES
jgi:hypothetical protein